MSLQGFEFGLVMHVGVTATAVLAMACQMQTGSEAHPWLPRDPPVGLLLRLLLLLRCVVGRVLPCAVDITAGMLAALAAVPAGVLDAADAGAVQNTAVLVVGLHAGVGSVNVAYALVVCWTSPSQLSGGCLGRSQQGDLRCSAAICGGHTHMHHARNRVCENISYQPYCRLQPRLLASGGRRPLKS